MTAFTWIIDEVRSWQEIWSGGRLCPDVLESYCCWTEFHLHDSKAKKHTSRSAYKFSAVNTGVDTTEWTAHFTPRRLITRAQYSTILKYFLHNSRYSYHTFTVFNQDIWSCVHARIKNVEKIACALYENLSSNVNSHEIRYFPVFGNRKILTILKVTLTISIC